MGYFKRTVNYIKKHVRKYYGIKRANKLGISVYPPNYIYFDRLNDKSIVVDVGCADDADYSVHIISQHNCIAYGVDPTRKHFASLRKLEQKYANAFFHLPYAVANQSGQLIFHESATNASGSILNDHINVKKDKVNSYPVEAVSINDLKLKIGKKIDILKLDLEGAEYELLKNINPADLDNIEQIFIEFHHHCVDTYSIKDTQVLVKKIEGYGFKSFSADNHNFLFYRN